VGTRREGLGRTVAALALSLLALIHELSGRSMLGNPYPGCCIAPIL
jgi:hypothetical protein